MKRHIVISYEPKTEPFYNDLYFDDFYHLWEYGDIKEPLCNNVIDVLVQTETQSQRAVKPTTTNQLTITVLGNPSSELIPGLLRICVRGYFTVCSDQQIVVVTIARSKYTTTAKPPP